MVNAILVLRIQILEIEKVNELCRDFAERYIEALKIKLNSDNIFKIDDDDEDESTAVGEEGEAESGDESKKSKRKTSGSTNSLVNKKKRKKSSSSKQLENSSNKQAKKEGTDVKYQIRPDTSMSSISLKPGRSEQPRIKITDYNSSPLSRQTSESDDCDERTGRSSRNEAKIVVDDDRSVNNEPTTDNDNVFEDDDEEEEITIDDDEDDEEAEDNEASGKSELNGKDESAANKLKRGILPKSATNVMKKWLFQHLVVII